MYSTFCLMRFNDCFPFILLIKTRSSRPKMFCKKVVLRNFANFIGKQLCQNLFFNKVAGLRLATLLKKRLWHRCFTVNFAKFLRTFFLTEHLRWLLLKRVYWKFYIQVPGFCNIHHNKAKSEDKIFLVIKTINLIWNTFSSLLYV